MVNMTTRILLSVWALAFIGLILVLRVPTKPVPETLTSGMFLCSTGTNLTRAWKSPDIQSLGNGMWKIFMPEIGKYVLFEKSMLESCGTWDKMPGDEEEPTAHKEPKPTTASK